LDDEELPCASTQLTADLTDFELVGGRILASTAALLPAGRAFGRHPRRSRYEALPTYDAPVATRLSALTDAEAGGRGGDGRRTDRRSPPSGEDRHHQAAAERLGALDQRYTRSRRQLVQALIDADRPLTIAEVVNATSDVPQSSAYRNLTVLCEAGVARRLPGTDDFGRFELAEDLGGHHHHLVCASCGALSDLVASPRLERAMEEASRHAATQSGFEITGHRVDFEGRCPECR